MLIKKILLASLLSTLTAPIFADSCTTVGHQQGDKYFGNTECQNVTLSQLTVNGPLKIDRLKVNGDVTINGLVKGYDVWIKNSLTINGQTTLNKVKIAGSTTIHGQTNLSDADLQDLMVSGQLTGSGSKFDNVTVNGGVNLRDVILKGNLTASSKLVILNGVEVKNIKINRSDINESQTICLEKATHVQNDITFESNKGKVYTNGASKIMGKVIGAQVTDGNCPNQSEMTAQ
jgi:hypothetical protein